jgi:hypothetical protein
MASHDWITKAKIPPGSLRLRGETGFEEGRDKGRRKRMKRSISLCCATLFLVSAAMLGCATVSEQKITLSANTVSGLKGSWSGTRFFDSGDVAAAHLEIYNTALPLEGKMTLEHIRGIALPGKASEASEEHDTIEFKNGVVTDRGTLAIQAETLSMELSLFDDGGKWMFDGGFSYYGSKGTLTLYKR